MPAVHPSMPPTPAAGWQNTEAELRRMAPSLADTSVIVVCGFPASGKSAVSQFLARLLGAVVLGKDTLVPDLEGAVMAELTGDPHDRDSDVYNRVVNQNVYRGLLDLGFRIGPVAQVVLDAPFSGQIRAAARQGTSLADYLRSTSSAEAAQITTIWVSAESASLHARMTHRGASRDAAKLADWDGYRTRVLESGLETTALRVVDHIVGN